jgi:small subunit ribosomal protein S16
MAVRIRLSRFGRLHRPFFRVVAIDSRCHREGKANEILGSYDPLLADKNLSVDIEALSAWVHRGAQMSTSVRHLLKRNGYAVPSPAATAATAAAAAGAPAPTAERAPAKKDGAVWCAPTRRAVRKHAARVKSERKSAAEAAKAARAAAAAAAPAPAADAAAPAAP